MSIEEGIKILKPPSTTRMMQLLFAALILNGGASLLTNNKVSDAKSEVTGALDAFRKELTAVTERQNMTDAKLNEALPELRTSLAAVSKSLETTQTEVRELARVVNDLRVTSAITAKTVEDLGSARAEK